MALLKVVSGEKPREIAARVLQRRASGHFVEGLLEQELAQARISAADRGLCQELVYGVVRWRATLDWLIGRKTGDRTQKPLLQDLLRLGLYQIFWLDRIPNHAAVFETVAMAKRSGLGQQSGFVNALLRSYLREFDATKEQLASLKSSQPALGYSHPEWLVARWQTRWGAEKTSQLLSWNNTPAKTYARVNTLKTDPGKLLAQWHEENVEYDFVRADWFEEGLIFELKTHPSLSRLPSFNQGLFYVQDPSTLLSVHALAPAPGDRILDLCAAPGGKTTYVAQRIGNQGELWAHDTIPDRIKLIEENCARLGVTCAKAVVSSGLETFQAASFDRVLVDAPCSNTGVMRRRIDLRWRVRAEEIARLRRTQLGLICQAALLLKYRGRLVYSTCSLEPEENRELIQTFLGEEPTFMVESERELLPFNDQVDGAYVVSLKKG